MQKNNVIANLDWLTIGIYLILCLIGWVNIYAAVFDPEHESIFSLSRNYGKQLLWIGTSLIIAFFILILDSKFYSAFSYLFFGITMALLAGVLVFGTEVAGSRSWFQIGAFKLQPAEFAKFGTTLALAKYLSTPGKKFHNIKTHFISFSIMMLPAVLILLQGDTGSALTYTAFILVLYREGLNQNILVVGTGVVIISVLALMYNNYYLLVAFGLITAYYIYYTRKKKKVWRMAVVVFLAAASLTMSVNYGFNNILRNYQQDRINIILGKAQDNQGAGYNLNQSMIAIGSGGFTGKGFLQGTQTKFDFVPEQSTDFIFCTVGEEYGFLGTFSLLALFFALFLRLIYLAERQRSDFSRIYGYGVASILFFHLMVNVGMTIGLMPVIGIPLPFLSYGGSSLWGFTILLFIMLRLDADRKFIVK